MSRNMKNILPVYEMQMAKAEYHKRAAEILTVMLDNETDPGEKKRLFARRSHHRRLNRKYMAWAEIVLNGG